jgi:hypothetical protein
MKNVWLPLLPVLLLAACSGVKTYPDVANKNVHLRTKVVDGSVMSSMHAGLNIYTVDAKCEATYVGTVELDEPAVDIGIPPGQLTYLMFVFSSKGMLGGVNSSTTYETLLRPRAGYEYRVDVRYVDDIYNVDLFETLPRSKQGHELPPRRLDSCRS